MTHAAIAIAIGKTYTMRSQKPQPWRFWFLSAACAILPDADVIGFAFGVRYGDMLGHRGFSHSILFAALVAFFVVRCAFSDKRLFTRVWWSLVFYFFIVTLSHGLLDALTDGGLGVAFFAPFDSARYFFPVTPVEVSPIGLSGFLSNRGADVLMSEFLWLWIPALLLVSVVMIYRRLTARDRQSASRPASRPRP